MNIIETLDEQCNNCILQDEACPVYLARLNFLERQTNKNMHEQMKILFSNYSKCEMKVCLDKWKKNAKITYQEKITENLKLF
jgi:hypothetical protein